MDFIEGLPTSQAYTVIMEVADRLSKYVHFVPLKHLFTALIVAKAFLSCIIKLHEVPRSITSNRDKVFVSVFLESFVLNARNFPLHKFHLPFTNR